MKKHEVLLDMINDSIKFSQGYCTHLRALLSLISLKPIEKTKTTPKARQKDIIPNRIPKRGSTKNLDNFLRTPKKILDKKRRLINTSKQKLAMQKQKPEIVVISSLDNPSIKDLPIPPQTSTPHTKEVDIVIIIANTYFAACKLKRTQVFIVSMRDPEY